jgi:hypothetical protein
MASRRRNRGHEQAHMLLSPDTADGRGGVRLGRMIRRISMVKGDRMVAELKAVRYDDPDTGDVIAFQLLQKESVSPVKTPAAPAGVLEPSQARFSRAESGALDSPLSASRTVTMDEAGLLRRLARGLPEMDLIQAAHVKRDEWNLVH